MGVVISQLCIDSADPVRLARWWAEALDWRVVPDDDTDEVAVRPPGSAGAADAGADVGRGVVELLFLRVPETKAVKNRLHLDLRPADGSDQATELDRLIALGARPVDVGQGEVTWHVLADPEGNELCLLQRTPSQLAAD